MYYPSWKEKARVHFLTFWPIFYWSMCHTYVNQSVWTKSTQRNAPKYCPSPKGRTSSKGKRPVRSRRVSTQEGPPNTNNIHRFYIFVRITMYKYIKKKFDSYSLSAPLLDFALGSPRLRAGPAKRVLGDHNNIDKNNEVFWLIFFHTKYMKGLRN